MLSDFRFVLRYLRLPLVRFAGPGLLRCLPVLLAAVGLGEPPLRACTILVLTDADHALFFNNEDWSNPATHLWFIPAGPDHLGCAYVGFDDGWAQGGVNTAGVAYDWVAGAMENYTPALSLTRVRGNSSQRMLETCTTVAEAIAFYSTHRETEFARARILIADRSGASIIIGAKNGALYIEHESRSRGFGYGREILRQQLASAPKPTLAAGSAILRACVQSGATPTQYANAFDLKSGDIFLYPQPALDAPVSLTLAAELAKGGHSYDISRLRTQLTQGPRPLRPEQRRFYLDEFLPLASTDPAITGRIERLLRTAASGAMRPADYTPELWAKLAPAQREMQSQIGALGSLRQVTLVARPEDSAGGAYRCIADFSGARVLQRFEFDADGKVAALASEFVELVRP